MEPAAEWISIDKLKPWEENPRRNEEAIKKVAESIQRFGFASPIIARKEDGQIIAGHTRYAASLDLGLSEIPVRFMDLDPADSRLLALADNRIGEIADWDDEKLSEILETLREEGSDITGLGWSDDELNDLLGDLALDDEPPAATDDLIPELQKEVISKYGEVYQLGPHRLMCGDCRSSKDFSTLLNGILINVAITSPPYASQRKYDESSGFKPIHPDDYVAWFEAVQANVRKYLAVDGSWFVNIKEHCEDGQRVLYVKDLTLSHVRDWEWLFVDEYIWTHGGTPKGPIQRFKNGFEPIFQFSLNRHKFNPDSVMKPTDKNNMVEGKCGGQGMHPNSEKIQEHGFKEGKRLYEYERRKKYTGNVSKVQGFPGVGAEISNSIKEYMDLCGMAYPSNVLSFGKNREALGHSAAFPINLPSFFIKAYSDIGDVIFDPFMGSGTSLIAAANENRISYGMEISPGYCDVIRRRWTNWAIKNDIDPGNGVLFDEGYINGQT